MGRIRTVKPELFLHEDLFDLEQETGLPVRLAFIGLWTQCDREGRFKWLPRKLKVTVLPYDEIDFSRVLHALTTRGFVRKYEHEGQEFGYVPGFSDHQVVNNREKPSTLPDPASCKALTCAPRVDGASGTRALKNLQEGKGREGNKLSKETSEADAPDKFTPEDESLADLIYQRVLDVAPKTKPPNLKAWADTIRLMRERDGHTHEEISRLFNYANRHQFWKTNVLSPEKLRAKFAKLDAEMRRDHETRQPASDSRPLSAVDRVRNATGQW